MAEINGFYGNLQGPFEANQQLFDKIKNEAVYENKENVYVSKLGIHIVTNYDLTVTSSIEYSYNNTLFQVGPRVFINDKEFQIGLTGMLELEDVNITSIKFEKDMDEKGFIDYQINIIE